MNEKIQTLIRSGMSSDSPSQLKRFAQAATAACLAIEVVKTRLQLQGEVGSQIRVYRNSFHALYKIAGNEGIFALQRGLIPAYFYQIAMNGVRFSEYDRWKLIFARIAGSDKPTNVTNVLAGVWSGVMGAALGSPFFLVKTRMQSYSEKFAVGAQHKYDGLIHALRKIFAEDGVRGLLSGTSAAMLRTGVGSGIQLATYDRARSFYTHGILPDNIYADFAASLTSGFMVCVGMNPFDVVSTRLYNQKLNHETHRGMYRGPIDCFVKTVRTEGVAGLYKGFFAHYLRIGPHTVLCFIFLEQIRRRS